MQHLIGEEKERTLVRAVLSLFLLVTKRLYGKEWEWSIGQIKTCRKKQHVEIDEVKGMSDLTCGKDAVGGNYNSTRDTIMGHGNLEVIRKYKDRAENALTRLDKNAATVNEAIASFYEATLKDTNTVNNN